MRLPRERYVPLRPRHPVALSRLATMRNAGPFSRHFWELRAGELFKVQSRRLPAATRRDATRREQHADRV